MTPATAPSKKTKAELLEDYQRLQEQYDELKLTARAVHDPQTAELFEKTKAYSADTITASISDLKSNVNTTLNDLAEKILAEAEKFGELQKAIDLSKKNLALNYNIQVAAETLQQTVREYRIKRGELEEDMANKKRDWDREQEEHEYATVREHKREQDEYQDMSGKREVEFKQRLDDLQSREEELQSMRAQVELFPQKLDKACAQAREDASKQMKSEYERQSASQKKDWEAQKNMLDLRIANLEDTLKRQNAEISSLKAEAERANKKAQELAVKVIEGGSRIAHDGRSRGNEEKHPASPQAQSREQ